MAESKLTDSKSTDAKPAEERLRQHPTERFAPPQIELDLAKVTAKLRAEPQAIERGRHQETLYHHGNCTIALFTFDAGTHMADHKAKGIVSMHVLRGRLKIAAEGMVHELSAGQLLVVAPGVSHAIAAEEASELLVNITLGG